MATVPNNHTFSLQDVVNVVGGGSLTAAFGNAAGSKFDPTYRGNQNELDDFQNYDTTRGATYTLSVSPTSRSGNGTFTVTVTASSGNAWTATTGSYGAWMTLNGGSSVSGNGNGSFTVVVTGTPTGGYGTVGSIGIVSLAPNVNISVTRT